jgi:hypothetical protein
MSAWLIALGCTIVILHSTGTTGLMTDLPPPPPPHHLQQTNCTPFPSVLLFAHVRPCTARSSVSLQRVILSHRPVGPWGAPCVHR